MYLISYIYIDRGGAGFDLTGKIRASNFVQKKSGEHKDEQLTAKPVVKLATAANFNLTEEKKGCLRSLQRSTAEQENPMITMSR